MAGLRFEIEILLSSGVTSGHAYFANDLLFCSEQ